MDTHLEEFFWDKYGAYPILLGSSRIRPGLVLEAEWSNHWLPRNKEIRGFKREYGLAWSSHLLGDEYEAEVVPKDANLLAGTMSEKVGFSADVALPQFGIKAGVGFAKNRRAMLRVDDVRVKMFKDGFTGPYLRRELRRLENEAPQKFEWIEDEALVVDSYHVAALRFEFESDGQASAKAAFEAEGVEVSAGVEYEWEDDETLVLQGTNEVPFAVRFLKI